MCGDRCKGCFHGVPLSGAGVQGGEGDQDFEVVGLLGVQAAQFVDCVGALTDVGEIAGADEAQLGQACKTVFAVFAAVHRNGVIERG